MKKGEGLGSRLFDIVNIAVLILFSLLCLFPFYYVFIYALSNPVLAKSGITWLPKGFTFQNFIRVMSLSDLPQAALISISRTVIAPFLILACSSFYAFLMTKQNMYFRKFFYRALVVTMYISGGLIPTFLVLQAYGFYNNYLIYILTGMINAYDVVLIKTFMEQLPPSLEESAKLDGAGPIRCWISIILPLCLPILATVMVFAVVAEWNSWFDTHLYVTNRKLWSLQYLLYRYLNEAEAMLKLAEQGKHIIAKDDQITPMAIRMTITCVVTLPILFVYPFMQKYFVKGIMIGAVKG